MISAEDEVRAREAAQLARQAQLGKVMEAIRSTRRHQSHSRTHIPESSHTLLHDVVMSVSAMRPVSTLCCSS